MNVTFLVTLNLDDLSSLTDVADEISYDLSNEGREVVSVQPWARPSINVPLTTNTTQPTQNPNPIT